ncbi:MAG TPA: thiamine phosphate synthase [Thermoanaerobaculia bacterium]|jgi:thiamine-phosphate pyrophosphorylase|nr:thiamine phosphate synthase [Thermoanaerobaculia bacterium]
MPVPAFKALAISDRATLPDRDAAAWLADLARAAQVGLCAVQIREKDLDDRAVYGLTVLARSLLPPAVPLLVNGRLDIALAAGADGAHLPADAPPVAALRARFGPDVLLGVSTHHLDEVEAARRGGADYVTFGPVYPTSGKAGYGPPQGVAALARAAAVGIPVYALGGVTLSRLAEVASAGAAGVAGIRLFQPPFDLAGVLRAVRRSFPA